MSLVHTETIAESVLPFIQTEVTEKPIDLAVKGLRKKLEHKYGRHSLTYANIGGIRRKVRISCSALIPDSYTIIIYNVINTILILLLYGAHFGANENDMLTVVE